MQDWPPTRRNFIATAPSTAGSRSASSKTMKGALPPSSKLRRLICRAAVSMIPLPTSVERSEEHTSELQSLAYLVCRLLLEKKKSNEQARYALYDLTIQLDRR